MMCSHEERTENSGAIAERATSESKKKKTLHANENIAIDNDTLHKHLYKSRATKWQRFWIKWKQGREIEKKNRKNSIQFHCKYFQFHCA